MPPIIKTVKLYVRDFERARAFYTETLELPAVNEIRPGVGEISLGETRLLLHKDTVRQKDTLPDGPRGGGVEVHFAVEEVDALYARLRDAGVSILKEPKDMPFGTRVFAVTDPDGYELYFIAPQ